MNKKIITRFAPSPTGNLNIGGVRAGIFAYLFARHSDGMFIVRIEDTDKERSKKEYEVEMLKSIGFKPVSAGERILRVETIVPVLLSKLTS